MVSVCRVVSCARGVKICVRLQVGLRILDHFFYEGYETTFLFKVALAVLKLQQDELLDQVDGFHVCNVLKRPSVDCEVLLSVRVPRSRPLLLERCPLKLFNSLCTVICGVDCTERLWRHHAGEGGGAAGPSPLADPQGDGGEQGQGEQRRLLCAGARRRLVVDPFLSRHLPADSLTLLLRASVGPVGLESRHQPQLLASQARDHPGRHHDPASTK